LPIAGKAFAVKATAMTIAKAQYLENNFIVAGPPVEPRRGFARLE
jgi:hypothetical protein